jgi:Flp pilus assembly pilin Flp
LDTANRVSSQPATPDLARRVAELESELRVLKRRHNFFAVVTVCVLALMVVPGLQTAIGMALLAGVILISVIAYLRGPSVVLDWLSERWRSHSSRRATESPRSTT